MASSSSKSRQKYEYEVFLSFRGEDTRNNFVSHLYDALERKGIRTFLDEENLESGQSLSLELLKAIEESKFAIIVFSKNYASSAWCLDELVRIMECKYKNTMTVIPIFYHMDPSDIRKQNNSFAEAFSKHEVSFKDNMEKVQNWKEKLREAATIKGHDFSGRNVQEALLINKIVDMIFSKLPLKASTEGLFGIEHRLRELRRLLDMEPNDVCFVGIWGMGGIGKTTIARVIFDELVHKFDEGCFLQDVYKKDMVDLQKAFLSKVLQSKVDISDEYEGRSMISNRLCSKRVLLVLDDVNDIEQLESLAGGRDWFGNGSRIIITTRDKHLLNDVNKFYEMETMSDNEAIELFSLHAFKKSRPPEDFVQLSDRVLEYASGLPLALKVLGSHLSGRPRNGWESTLDRLKHDPEDKIDVRLKISFDSLTNTQQEIFLDIACFFRGNDKDYVIKNLDSFGFHPSDGIEVLQEKSLIHISDDIIQMHDLIQDMGQNIVRQKANKDPGKYSRLWDAKEIMDVLTNDKGTSEVEGFVVTDHIELKLNGRVFENMNKLRIIDFGWAVKSVISPNDHRSSSNNSSLNYLPNSLRLICWHLYPCKSLPVNFRPTNLVSLDLSYSLALQTFPDVSDMPNLETLILYQCEKKLEVHPSVGVHKKLVCLNLGWFKRIKKISGTMQMKSLETLVLQGCSRLQSLPQFHSNMTSLRTLLLDKSGIKYLPWSLGCLTSLQKIDLRECKNLRALPNNLCGLKKLESVKLSWCSKLKFFFENPDDKAIHCFGIQQSSLEEKREENEYASKILTAFLSLPSLRTLHMIYCNVSELILSESTGCFGSLEELDLSCNNFVSLPESINRFSCLRLLCLSDCGKLEELTELPPRIKTVNLNNCTALTRIPNLVDLVNKYKNLQFLSLIECEKLVQKQDELDSPQFLFGLLDWGTAASDILCNRQKMIQVHLPGNYLFNWLHKSTGPEATVTLSPSCFYNDKLRGFVICAISNIPSFGMVTDNGRVTIIPSPGSYSKLDLEHLFFFYIPIGKITHGTDRNEEKDYCLLEVTNAYWPTDTGEKIRWGITLVYDTELNMDFSDLTVTNSPLDSYKNRTFKVCVAPRIQI